MVKITIENLAQKEITGSSGILVLSIIHESGVDWMHACGGKGRCTTCKFIVREGMEHLSPLTAVEQNYRQQDKLSSNERLACQTQALGDIRVRVAQENKLPHMSYTD